MFAGPAVDAIQVPVDEFEHPRIHDPEPQGRHIGQHEHAEIAAGQLGHVLVVTERLVAACRVSVVIRVPLQVVQDKICLLYTSDAADDEYNV